jgi:hypothetical protein
VKAKKISKNRDHGLGLTASGVISSLFSLLRFSVSFVMIESDKLRRALIIERLMERRVPTFYSMCAQPVYYIR